jgi:hypothetical protein
VSLPGTTFVSSAHEPPVRWAHETFDHGVNASSHVASGSVGERPSAA